MRATASTCYRQKFRQKREVGPCAHRVIYPLAVLQIDEHRCDSIHGSQRQWRRRAEPRRLRRRSKQSSARGHDGEVPLARVGCARARAQLLPIIAATPSRSTTTTLSTGASTSSTSPQSRSRPRRSPTTPPTTVSTSVRQLHQARPDQPTPHVLREDLQFPVPLASCLQEAVRQPLTDQDGTAPRDSGSGTSQRRAATSVGCSRTSTSAPRSSAASSRGKSMRRASDPRHDHNLRLRPQDHSQPGGSASSIGLGRSRTAQKEGEDNPHCPSQRWIATTTSSS